MRVLYFHQHFNTPAGIGGLRSYMMARGLIEAGHAVTMVCGRHDGCVTGITGKFSHGKRRGQFDGIDIMELDLPYANKDGFVRRALVFLKFAWRSIGIALTEPCDVVFATTTPLTAGIPGIAAHFFKRKPFVFEVRDLWPELPKAMGVITNPLVLWAMSALEWASYRSADKLIALAGGIANGIEARGVDKSRITVIPNGCDLNIFDQGLEGWRPDGVGAGDFLALYAGTHGMANGLDAVIDAAAELKRRGHNEIKFVLIGDGRCKPELMARAGAENLDNIIFLDPVPKARLAQLMRSTDIGMQVLDNIPAFYQGTSPNKFFDYIAAGLPVLNNYPGWLAEMIEESGCGFAVPPANPSAFADVLIHAADNRAQLASMGMASKKLAEQRFNRRNLAKQFTQWVTTVDK
jgi:glycosyltransferase involved in cell wall biosynthesis